MKTVKEEVNSYEYECPYCSTFPFSQLNELDNFIDNEDHKKGHKKVVCADCNKEFFIEMT